MNCNICPRKCNVNRDERIGFCQSPNEFRLARASLHFWEEPCISGENGSGAVFFSGCNLKCVYCQNFEISSENKGKAVSPEKLLDIFKALEQQGANNINLVNPTHWAVQLLPVLEKWNSKLPVIWNSSGYEDAETLKMLSGLVDIYLPDFKYIRNDRAKKYSRAEDYPQIAKAAINEMRNQLKEDVFDERGIMQKGLIIRHLILPSNTNSSLEIIDFLSENYPETYLSLMAQYTPCTKLDEFPEINRGVTKREYDKVVNYALDKGLEKLFIQELSSADKNFIPAFDFSGVL
ncbi:MAG: radical SAM protein [Ruminococcaceae bacterium]|nr:radical SAM protein [Oscillospiraceae bacterium]